MKNLNQEIMFFPYSVSKINIYSLFQLFLFDHVLLRKRMKTVSRTFGLWALKRNDVRKNPAYHYILIIRKNKNTIASESPPSVLVMKGLIWGELSIVIILHTLY